MEQDKLVALTATLTGVPVGKTAEVLEVAAKLETVESDGSQPAESVEGGIAQPAVAATPSEDIEQGEPSDSTERVSPLEAALKKADAAFGGRDGSRASRLAYSERSGLLG